MFDSAVMEEGLGLAAEKDMPRRSSMGASPDGLGAYVQDASPGTGMSAAAQMSPMDPYQPQQQAVPYSAVPHSQMQGEIDFLEPDDTSSGAATRSGGITLLFVALSSGIGYALKGGFGMGAGLLISAGAANAYRAQKWWDSGDPSERHEAIVSGVFALAEIATGVFIGYKAYQLPDDKKKKSKD